MRTTPTIIAISAALLCAAPSIARAQNPSQLLQGLLSGNQNQDQPVRDAYERGYRQGREDQVRDDRNRGDRDRRGQQPQQQRGQYPDQDQNQQYQRNQYQR